MPPHSPAPNAPIRDETVQTCPRCGGGSLHHCEIIVYDREDDAALVRRTRVNNGRVALDVVPEGPANPSSRRNGLTISFSCENCSAVSLRRGPSGVDCGVRG